MIELHPRIQLRPIRDPLPQHCALGIVQRLRATLQRRHHILVGVRQRHALQQLTLVRLAWDDHIAAANCVHRVQAQFALRLRLLLTVAGETMAIKHRQDVLLETRRVRGDELSDEGHHRDAEAEKCRGHTIQVHASVSALLSCRKGSSAIVRKSPAAAQGRVARVRKVPGAARAASGASSRVVRRARVGLIKR